MGIFRGWHTRIGGVNEHERLRIGIITGIKEDRPHSYTVMIGTNEAEGDSQPSSRRIVTVVKSNRMEPQDSPNLTTFLHHYRRATWYWLLPAWWPDDAATPSFIREIAIKKTS